MSRARVGIIGAGAWGTALAQLVSPRAEVLLWSRNRDVVHAINTHHRNPHYLPAAALDPALRATGDAAALAASDLLIVATPAQHVRAILGLFDGTAAPRLLCAKGIEAGTHALMSEVARVLHPCAPVAVLSGPTFATEVAHGLPTAVTLACADAAVGAQLTALLATPMFRPYLTCDVVGAEIGGALKNVFAIACGVTEGARLGQNARAALIARSFAEMLRFGQARGANPETLHGLSGFGDLVLTCTSAQSRNYALGAALGAGARADDLMHNRTTVAEGAATAPVLQAAARALGVDMPVVDAVCALLSGAAAPADIIATLLARPLRPE